MQAEFFRKFGDPLRNPHGYAVAALKDLVTFYSGGTPSKKRGDYWQGATPWVSAKEMKDERITTTSLQVSERVFAETPLRKLPTGTPLLVTRGMILARDVPIAQLSTPAAINQDLKALLPRDNSVRLDYLTAHLRAMSDYLLTKVTHAAHGTTRLETRHLEELPVMLPSQSAVHEFLRTSASARSIFSKRGRQSEQLHKLKLSTQSRAFRGEL